MNENIAVIGEESFVSGFQGLGIDLFRVQGSQSAQQLLEKLVKEMYPIIYITETYAQEFMELIEQLSKVSHSSIVIIPGIGIDKKLGEKKIRSIIRRAIGTDDFNTKRGE